MSEERVMVLTGSATGLGAEVAEHFALQGFRVVINYINEVSGQQTFDRIADQTSDQQVMKYRADVANREQVRGMFDAVIETFQTPL